MSAKYLKANIRHDKIRIRSKKPCWKSLTPLEKRYVQLNDRCETLTKAIDDFWSHARYITDAAGQTVVDQQQNDWELFHSLNDAREKVSASIGRMEAKHALTPEAIEMIYAKHLSDSRRLYGGSF